MQIFMCFFFLGGGEGWGVMIAFVFPKWGEEL